MLRIAVRASPATGPSDTCPDRGGRCEEQHPTPSPPPVAGSAVPASSPPPSGVGAGSSDGSPWTVTVRVALTKFRFSYPHDQELDWPDIARLAGMSQADAVTLADIADRKDHMDPLNP